MDIAERNKLVEDNLGLIHYALKRYASYENYDDICQEGRIALINAAERYDATIGCAFSTYAVSCISRYVLSMLSTDYIVRLPAHIANEKCTMDRWVNRHPGGNIEEQFGKESAERYRRVCQMLDTVHGDMPLPKDEKYSWDYTGTCFDMIPAKEDVEKQALYCELDQKVRNFYTTQMRDCEQKQMAERCYFDDPDIEKEYSKNDLRLARIWYMNNARSKKMVKKFRNEFCIPEEIQDKDIPDYLYGERQ